MSGLAAGEVVLEAASRRFAVHADRQATLKEVVLRRRRRPSRRVTALDDVNLRISPGETVGLVGRNGAGKTSTLKVLAGIIPLDSGRVDCGGRVLSLLELGAGFGRDFSGRENIYLSGALYGLQREEVEQRVEQIIEFSELADFIDAPVRTYSSGMFVRLGFAIVAHLDADVLLIDEVLAVGDEGFQRKCLKRVSEQIAEGSTLVLVSHEAGSIERTCDRVVVLEDGRVAFDGPTGDGLLFYHRLMGTSADAWPSIRRPVDRQLQVTEVGMRGSDGHRRERFEAGEHVRVVVELAAREPQPGDIDDPEVVLEVRDEQGRRVFRTATALASAQREGAIAFEIPRLALLGGEYDLAAGTCVDPDGAAAYDRLLRFSVADAAGAEGLADLRGEWVRVQAEVSSR